MTAQTDRIALRMFFRIAKAWQLDPAEQSVLLGAAPSTCERWQNDEATAALSAETLARLGYLLDIYASLQVLLPVQERADAWVRQPTMAPVFGGKSALGLMLGGQVGDVRDVAGYLAAMCGGDFS